ncbi:MAG: hypothetical protein V3R72_08280, partial [Gammaproteobacteria bacterium]
SGNCPKTKHKTASDRRDQQCLWRPSIPETTELRWRRARYRVEPIAGDAEITVGPCARTIL